MGSLLAFESGYWIGTLRIKAFSAAASLRVAVSGQRMLGWLRLGNFFL
jgi:hypothetical protein